ncbi:Membrane protein insertase YidC [Flavobacteriales bacterium]|nr:Membrane protein insertase YidC [Flavobacteriales bacterium]CAG0976039.1 Membrane protein insertase YidC [Flavobacteriales bacterium]
MPTQNEFYCRMDRNGIIGLILIAAIVITYGIINAPSKEEIEKAKAKKEAELKEKEKQEAHTSDIFNITNDTLPTDSSAHSVTDTLLKPIENDSVQNALLLSKHGVFSGVANGKEEIISLENEKISFQISTKGARITTVMLKEYQTYYKEPLVLFDKDSSFFNFNFFTTDNKDIHTAELFFEPSTTQNIRVSGEKDSAVLVLKLPSNQPEKYIEFVYTLKGNSYMVDFDVRMVGMNDVVSPRTDLCYLNWWIKSPNQEKTIENQQNTTTIYFKYKEEVADYINEMKDEKNPLEASTKWVAFKQQFFSAVIISDTHFDKADAFIETKKLSASKYVKQLTASLSLPYQHKEDDVLGMQFYFGPNHYQTLSSYHLGLEKLIPLGWGILGWVNKYLVIPVFNFLDSFNLNYGIIILLLTIFIKLLLSPITYRNFVSSAKMKVLKPEIAELNEKHKSEPLKKQQAVMELYKRAGVNPFAGCIPVLLQMPILIALFRFFPASIELRQQGFLWADDLSTYDSVLELPFSIPFYGEHVSLFTILMAISIFFYSKATGQIDTTSKDPMAVQMRIMMYIMPFMMLFFFNNYSAGLSYYYLVANLITIGQTWAIRKWVINEAAIHKQIQENKKKPVKKSQFQQRLEDMAKQRSLGKKK